MGLYDYLYSFELSKKDPPFYGLLFSMLRKADTENTAKIKAMWPEEYAEFERRYHAPGGILAEDNMPPNFTPPPIEL